MENLRNFDDFGKVLGVLKLSTDSVLPNHISTKHVAKFPKYKLLKTEHGVSVRLPKASESFVYVQAFIPVSGRYIPAHWRNGKLLSKGIYFNVCYYNISEEIFGRNVTCTVDVLQKTFEDGREFTMANITHTPGVPCVSRLKLPENATAGIPIIGSNHKIVFSRL